MLHVDLHERMGLVENESHSRHMTRTMLLSMRIPVFKRSRNQSRMGSEIKILSNIKKFRTLNLIQRLRYRSGALMTHPRNDDGGDNREHGMKCSYGGTFRQWTRGDRSFVAQRVTKMISRL